MGIDVGLVKRILGEDEYSERAVDLLLKCSEKGKIEFEKLNHEDLELFLLLSQFKLALPVDSVNDSLSWNSRILNSATKTLEIPYLIRVLFSRLRKDGVTTLEDVVVDYFRAIGEEKPEEFVDIIRDIYEAAKNLIVCGEEISTISHKYGRDGGVVISELKGAGAISPLAGCGGFQAYGSGTSPVYEVNTFLYEIFKLEKRERQPNPKPTLNQP